MNEAIVDLVRRHDPDRFLTALFAPAERRDALLTLYAVNHELARAGEVASAPPLALIRLQWWREVVEGTRKRHIVASPLSALLQCHTALAGDLAAMIAVREQEIEGSVDTIDAWRQSTLAGGGSLSVAAARLLGANEPEAFRRFGAAYAMAGQVRTMRLMALRGQCLMPVDLLAQHGLTVYDAIAEPDRPAVRDALTALVREGQAVLGVSRSIPRAAVSAALPATLARRDFARWMRRPGNVILQRGIGDKLWVIGAALTRRL